MPSVVVINQPGVQIASGSSIARVSTSGRLYVEDAGASIADISGLVRDFVWRSGSTYLRVDGSTPKEFSFTASLSQNIIISELRILMTADTIEFDGTKFGSHLSLSNGVSVQVISGGTTGSIANIKVNEEFFLQAKDNFFDRSGTKDVLMVTYGLGLPLYSGSGDKVRITIRDDLTHTSYNIRYFVGSISGYFL